MILLCVFFFFFFFFKQSQRDWLQSKSFGKPWSQSRSQALKILKNEAEAVFGPCLAGIRYPCDRVRDETNTLWVHFDKILTPIQVHPGLGKLGSLFKIVLTSSKLCCRLSHQTGSNRKKNCTHSPFTGGNSGQWETWVGDNRGEWMMVSKHPLVP